MKRRIVVALAGICLITPHFLCSQVRPVDAYGQLSVDGRHLRDQCGRFAQLKGPSFFWSQWEGREYWNEDVVEWLASDWKAEVVRASMGVRPGDCCDYFGQTETTVNQLRRVIDGAIASGIYVIIDWHAHGMHTTEARAFFSDMARIYGEYPNVLYEIYNEPTGSSWTDLHQDWADLKEYSRILIAAIREHDPDNIILCPTPFYDQFVHHAADDPIEMDIHGNPVMNIAYTLHVYAGSHRFDGIQGSWAKEALSKGLPLFVTECAPVGTDFAKPRSTSINAPNYEEWSKWQTWWDEHHISYTTWSLSTKDEYSAALLPGAPVNGNWDYHNHLSGEGQWYRDHFHEQNETLPCEGVHVSRDSLIFRYLPDTQEISLFTIHPIELEPGKPWVQAVLSPDSSELQISVTENTGGFRTDTLLIKALGGDSTKRELYIIQWPYIGVDSLRISEDSLVLGLHQRLPANVQVFPFNADNESLVWTFADTSVARAEQGNLIRSYSEGQTMAYATSVDNGAMDSVLILVKSCLWDVNLALFRPVQASTVSSQLENPGFGPGSAVDGNSDSYWISGFGYQPEFVIDLERVFFLDRILIDWKEPCSEGYILQVSEDSTTWYDIAFGTGGVAGTHDFNQIQMWASYVRIQGNHHTLNKGASITELEIYGCSQNEGTYLQASPPVQRASHRDTLVSFHIFSNSEYTFSATGDWFTMKLSPGEENDVLSCTFHPNTGDARSGSVIIQAGEISRTLIITQDEGPAGITATPEEIQCPASDTIVELAISATSSYTLTSDQHWARPAFFSGYGNGNCQVRIASNETGLARTAVIVIQGEYSAATILIHQNAVQAPTGIHLDVQPELRVYPNPARDRIAIRTVSREAGMLLVSLYDADGRTLLNDNRLRHPGGAGEYRLGLSASGPPPPPGMYLLVIRFESAGGSTVLHRKLFLR